MKNKQAGFIVPLVLIIIAVIGIGAGVHYAKKAKVHTEVQSDTTTTTGETNVGANLTVQELLAQYKGKNVMCTGSTTAADGTVVASTTYISGDTIRGDSTITSKGVVTTGGVIVKGTDMYGWSGNTGAKMKLSAAFDFNAALSKSVMNQKTNYTCKPWIVDAAKFVAPASVKFTDMGSVTLPSNINAGTVNTLKAKAKY